MFVLFKISILLSKCHRNSKHENLKFENIDFQVFALYSKTILLRISLTDLNFEGDMIHTFCVMYLLISRSKNFSLRCESKNNDVIYTTCLVILKSVSIRSRSSYRSGLAVYEVNDRTASPRSKRRSRLSTSQYQAFPALQRSKRHDAYCIHAIGLSVPSRTMAFSQPTDIPIPIIYIQNDFKKDNLDDTTKSDKTLNISKYLQFWGIPTKDSRSTQTKSNKLNSKYSQTDHLHIRISINFFHHRTPS